MTKHNPKPTLLNAVLKRPQPHRHALIAERRRTLLLASPLIGAQLLLIGNGLVDTLVAGRMGRVELAAGGIGAAMWFIVLLAGIGLMAGLSPTIAKLLGENRRLAVGAVYRQGLWLGVGLGILGFLLLSVVTASLHLWGLEAELIPEIRNYLQAARWSMLPAILLLAPRNICEATGRTRPVLLVGAIALVVNIVGDLGFGLGWFGLPALGLTGIGWSTSLVNLVMCIALLWLVSGRGFRRYHLYQQFEVPRARRLLAMLALSTPICLTMLFEAGLFTATAVQMGMLGTVPASAHNIAIGVTAFFFMLPLGLGFALTARLGVALGKQYGHSIQLRVINGILLTLTMGIGSSLILVIFRAPIAALYTDDLVVQQLAGQLLLLAAIFQIPDGLQATLIAMLRGLHDTRVPMLINLFSYWVVGFCVGYYAAHHLNYGAFGLWFGLIFGLSISAALLGWRLHNRVRHYRTLFG